MLLRAGDDDTQGGGGHAMLGVATHLLLGGVPQRPVDGVCGDVGPVDVALPAVPVQRHGVAHVGQRDDVIRHVLGVEADPTDVRPSGKKQELVKT